MPSTYKQSFKQNYTDNVELSIFNCGLQSCERGYTWGPGVRDHYLIHYVVDGKGTYTVNNTVYELRAGSFCGNSFAGFAQKRNFAGEKPPTRPERPRRIMSKY